MLDVLCQRKQQRLKYFLEGAGIGWRDRDTCGSSRRETTLESLLPHAVRKLFDSKPEPIKVELGMDK